MSDPIRMTARFNIEQTMVFLGRASSEVKNAPQGETIKVKSLQSIITGPGKFWKPLGERNDETQK